MKFLIITLALSLIFSCTPSSSDHQTTDLNPQIVAQDIVNTCPTSAEIKQIENDFKFVWEPDALNTTETMPDCNADGKESSAKLTLYHAFLAFEKMVFDKPVAFLNTINLYDWLKQLSITITVFDDTDKDLSHAGGDKIYLKLSNLSASYNRDWVNPQSGVGLMDIMALILHEARHTIPGGGYPHDCEGSKDSSLEMGGAWAVQYAFYEALSQDQNILMSDYARKHAQANAKEILELRICSSPFLLQ